MKVIRHVWFWGDPTGENFGNKTDASLINSMVHVQAQDVFPLFSAVLARQQIKNPFTQFQFSSHAAPALTRRRVAHVRVLPGDRESGMDVARIAVPPGHTKISHPTAALLVLETIDAGVRTLGSIRGWPSDRVDVALSETRELLGARHALKADATSGFRVSAELVGNTPE